MYNPQDKKALVIFYQSFFSIVLIL